MELRHMRTFAAVARHLNFTAAAAELYVAQPAVSQTIRDLEMEMEVTLFQRTKRSVRLTAAGAVFLREVTRLLKETGDAVRVAQRAARGEVGKVVLGFMGPAVTPFLPQVVRTYRERYPDVELCLHEMMPTEQLRALGEGRIDVGFTRPTGPSGEKMGLTEELIYTDCVVAALPEGHALAKVKKLALRKLADEPLVIYERTGAPGLFDTIMATCRAAGVVPRIEHEPDLMTTVLTLVAAGSGIGLVPGCVATRETAGVRFCAIMPASEAVPLVMAWSEKIESPTVGAFIDVMRDLKPMIRAQMEGCVGKSPQR
jgi:DNA-binding transcriptional LysR family regulator